MKKIIFSMAVILTVALASCSNSKKHVDEDSTVEALSDTTAIDSADEAFIVIENDSVCE